MSEGGGGRRVSAVFRAGLLGAFALIGCAGESSAPVEQATEMTLRSRADSVAMMAFKTSGGNAWDEIRYVRFDFAVESEGERGPTRKHLWDRFTGDYRLEWPASDDTTVVVLFNVSTRAGKVYENGKQIAGNRADEILASAYSRHINDTYWLMAPCKVFDPGVVRGYSADSSSADVEVLALSFENVGLTPGDRYWMKVDPETGDLAGWAYVLEGSPNRTSMYEWTAYQTFETPAGAVRLSERKEAVGANRAVLTDRVSLPERVDDGTFSDPSAVME